MHNLTGRNILMLTLPLILGIQLFVSSNLNWYGDSWTSIIESDGKGYYAYLPAIFIYKDLNFGYFDEIERNKYYRKNLFYDYRSTHNGHVIDKYYCGTAVAMTPFFLLAHVSSMIFGYPADGYSKLYHVFINIAGIFYLILGCYYMARLLRSYEIRNRQIAFVLLAIVYGTNLFYYAVCEPSMSHIYSFALIAMFVYYLKRWFAGFRGAHLVALFMLLGLIVLIRPINIIVILIVPFISGGMKQITKAFSAIAKKPYYLIIALLVFAAIVSVQLGIYKIQTGDFIIYSYGNEGFDFLSPHMTDILFSYKKGLFLYTPLLLISFVGLVPLYQKNKTEFYSLLWFLLVFTYIVSSWHCWWYGGSFSSRVYIDIYALFCILLALAVKRFSSRLARSFLVALIFVFIVICQIQTYQYRYYQIHWSEMTGQKYWDVFLRLDKL